MPAMRQSPPARAALHSQRPLLANPGRSPPNIGPSCCEGGEWFGNASMRTRPRRGLSRRVNRRLPCPMMVHPGHGPLPQLRGPPPKLTPRASRAELILFTDQHQHRVGPGAQRWPRRVPAQSIDSERW
eukprot:scaffold10960_cov115-Isochrysis_galbana.AAC.2